MTLLNYIVLNNAKRLALAIILGREERERERENSLDRQRAIDIAKSCETRLCEGVRRGEGWGSFFVSRRFRAKTIKRGKKEKREKEGTTPLAPTGDLVG